MLFGSCGRNMNLVIFLIFVVFCDFCDSWPIGDLLSDWKWDENDRVEKAFDERWKDISDNVYTRSEYRGGKSYLTQQLE
jgi:hypothetical protein